MIIFIMTLNLFAFNALGLFFSQLTFIDYIEYIIHMGENVVKCICVSTRIFNSKRPIHTQTQ